jgi:hypothetical protein
MSTVISSAHFKAAAASGTESRIRTYRRVLFVSIALNMAAAVFILFWPHAFAAVLGQPDPYPTTWPRHWGAQLLAINFLYFPGYADPLRNRWPNVAGIVIRLTFALFFFSQGDGFIPMGIYDGTFGLLLLITYSRVLRAND